MAGNGTFIEYRAKPESKKAVESTDGKAHIIRYKPSNKKERDARRRVYDRFQAMRDDPIRKEAEKEWELGRKMYRMWAPPRAEDDWGADITLPDGFSAIQTYLQETINARFRPILDPTESSDEVLARFNNGIFQHAMDTTEFDPETFKARMASAMMGTAFTREEYRYETREVMDPDSFKDGKIEYKKKEITDYDDVYTRYVRPENCFFDETAEDPKYGIDCIYREVLPFDTFQELYADRPGFENVDKVVAAGAIHANAQFFKMASDMGVNDVEILHYEHKLTDSYDVLANNVMIRVGPMPSKHKQLTLDPWAFYPIEGQIYGMGIPKIIYTLVEERRTNRNQQIDRGTLQNAGMFLVNDMFDLDEDDLTPRPHGLVKVNTQGLPIRDAIMPITYGDTPMSSIRMDDTLLTDERRAHGMDDRPANQAGGTATEAAIVKESTQLRINLVNMQMAWNTLIAIGKKKWSNIQFFYPAPRMERIMQDNKWHDGTKKYRTIKTPGMEFKLVEKEETGGGLELVANEIAGKGRFQLEPTFARFMRDDYDVVMDAQAMAIVSKPIKRQETNEMFDRLASNPIIARYLDGQKSAKRMFVLNDEDPHDWLVNEGMTDADMQRVAEQENLLFIEMERSGKLFALPGTPKATEAHTQVHLIFQQSQLFKDLSPPVQQVIINHITEENEKNPNVPNIADMMAGGGGPAAGGIPLPPGMDGPPQGGGGNAVPPGQPGGPDAGAGMGPLPGTPTVGGDVTAAA